MKERILLIVNPISGGKDKRPIVRTVLEHLDKERFETQVEYTRYAGHASELAAASDASVVVAIGGDGTQNEVARGLMGSSKALGIIPCGSGDGLALHLGISRNIVDAVNVLNHGVIVRMDCGSLDGKPFFCTSGMGFDALVGWRFAQAGTRGLKTYIKEAWNAWWGFVPDEYTIHVDGVQQWSGPAAMVTVGNANQWGNQARVTPLASVSDGLLDVTVVKPFHLWDVPELAAKLMLGKIRPGQHVRMFKGSEIEITRSKEGPMHYDGDPFTMGKHVQIKVMPSVLNVLVPKDRSNSI